MGDRYWNMTDDELGRLVQDALIRLRIPIRSPVLNTTTRRLPQAYPVYEHGYEAHFQRLDEWLSGLPRLLTFGRQGLFAHDNTHHALAMAYAVVDCLTERGALTHPSGADFEHNLSLTSSRTDVSRAVSNLTQRDSSSHAPLITVPCPGCGSEERASVYPSTIPTQNIGRLSSYSYDVLLEGHHPVVKCLHCGLCYTSPRDPQEVLARAYVHGSVQSYQREALGKLVSFSREAQFLKKLCGPGGTLLEIGCATGLFLRAASEIGFDVRGCDPWVEAARLAQAEFGDRIRIGPFNADDFANELFRVITLWDVLEHVDQPAGLIQEIHNLLLPGGWLALSTPNFDSTSRRLLQSRWQFLERPHLVYFNADTITRLLTMCGFTEIHIEGQWKTYSASYFAGYMAKWAPRTSAIALRVISSITKEGGLRLTLPSGCMRVYARKKGI